jgi:Tfp pilus assembly protein PilX
MSRLEHLRDETGSSLVVGIIILLIISMLGAVVALATNVQSHQTAKDRSAEQAFNLAESALNAETALLETNWPNSTASAYPVCTQASTAGSTCPQAGVAGGYNSTYAGTGFASATWSVQVIDPNVTGVADPSYYSDGILSSSQLLHYDSNSY